MADGTNIENGKALFLLNKKGDSKDMKKTSKLIVLMLALCMALVPMLSACGNKTEEPDEGQNPIMNFVGTYGHDRATIVIGATDEQNGANATVTWASSAAENSEWVMSGTFDAETLQFEYHDCVKTDYVYGEDGNVQSKEEVYTGGHGFMTFKEGDPLTLTWQDDQENIADGTVFEYSSAVPEDGGVGTANPWSEVGSLAEAAEKAGLYGFDIAEGSEISLGKLDVSAYRCMEGLAEAVIEFPASEIRIRKGLASVAAQGVGEGDISGDYGEYKNTWTQNIKGLEVTCFGNREGDASKIIWQSGDYCYSITAEGLGGDEDFGLNADDISSLINGIQ